MITDEYINGLFEGTNFGEPVNSSVGEKRALIAKTLQNQLDGYWSGHTIYHICLRGGFLFDSPTTEQKRLTKLGEMFLTGA